MGVHVAKILLVEDNPGDVDLVRVAIEDNKVCNELYVATDGVEALAFCTGKASSRTPRGRT
jgi:CheY-like chemotaxis protein